MTYRVQCRCFGPPFARRRLAGDRWRNQMRFCDRDSTGIDSCARSGCSLGQVSRTRHHSDLGQSLAWVSGSTQAVAFGWTYSRVVPSWAAAFGATSSIVSSFAPSPAVVAVALDTHQAYSATSVLLGRAAPARLLVNPWLAK